MKWQKGHSVNKDQIEKLWKYKIVPSRKPKTCPPKRRPSLAVPRPDRIKSGRIFVSYVVHMAYEGEKNASESYVESAALLKSGEELGVASLGDKTLALRATYVDEEVTQE